MGFYLPLRNFKHDSGPRRVQSGPNREDYIASSSGIQDLGADEGFVVAGPPLSGVFGQPPVGNTTAWRYIPSTLATQSGSIDPTAYNTTTTALDYYDGYKPSFKAAIAGASVRTSLGADYGVVTPRQAPLQPNVGVTRPEKYMYFGGVAPSNQAYTPYNTPDANTAAEGTTGGPVTHRNYESGNLLNVLGSQGTSDRSQWRYSQPVYCKTYTETVRSEAPGLMSTATRYMYRGGSTTYSFNYGALVAGSVLGSASTGLKNFPV
jgi:hypothetical protein